MSDLCITQDVLLFVFLMHGSKNLPLIYTSSIHTLLQTYPIHLQKHAKHTHPELLMKTSFDGNSKVYFIHFPKTCCNPSPEIVNGHTICFYPETRKISRTYHQKQYFMDKSDSKHSHTHTYIHIQPHVYKCYCAGTCGTTTTRASSLDKGLPSSEHWDGVFHVILGTVCLRNCNL